MILLPDPQTYVKFGRNQPILDLMMEWIVGHIDSLNIKLVLCTGDLVENNELLTPDGSKADQSSHQQWKAVSGSFDRLNGYVPYITATGNHDYGIMESGENRLSNFSKYFPADKNFLNQKHLRHVAINGQGLPSLENAAYEFLSPTGKKFLIVSLEFAPRDTVVRWAKNIVAMEKYRDHEVVVLTHSYLSSKNERIKKEKYKMQDANYGEALWEKLIKPAGNIHLVLSGHIARPDDIDAHMGFRVDKNDRGEPVNQMAFNAQALGGGWYGNGGDGWLRILEFLPGGKTVKVKTFSPLFAISPTTQQFAWRKGPHDEFTFDLN